jgi:hypothetical protein
MEGRHYARSVRGPGRAGDLSPGLELWRHLLAAFGGRAELTPRAAVRCDRAIRGKKALGMSRGLESPPTALSLAGWLVRILGPGIQVPVLPMFHTSRTRGYLNEYVPSRICLTPLSSHVIRSLMAAL